MAAEESHHEQSERTKYRQSPGKCRRGPRPSYPGGSNRCGRGRFTVDSSPFALRPHCRKKGGSGRPRCLCSADCRGCSAGRSAGCLPPFCCGSEFPFSADRRGRVRILSSSRLAGAGRRQRSEKHPFFSLCALCILALALLAALAVMPGKQKKNAGIRRRAKKMRRGYR